MAYLCYLMMSVTLIFRRLRCHKCRTLLEVEFSLLRWHFSEFFSGFTLFELILVYLSGPLQLFHDHLSIVLLLHQHMCILSLFILLIPAPFIHLRLGESRGLRHPATRFLRPIWVLGVFLHEVLHLVRILTISLLTALYWSLILHLLVPRRNRTANLLMSLWAKLTNFRWLIIFCITVGLGAAQYQGFQAGFSAFPILVTCSIMNKAILILK